MASEKELGHLVNVHQDEYDDGIQDLVLEFSNGEKILQKRSWPSIQCQGESSAESLHERLYYTPEFEALSKANPDMAFKIITHVTSLVEGPDIKPEPDVAAESFNRDALDIIDSNVIHDRWFKLTHYKLKYRLHGGGWSEETEHYVTEARDGVGVLLYCPEDDTVGLIEEFRCGAMHSASPWITHIVTGGTEEGESHEVAAVRECEEEAGIRPSSLIPLGLHWPSPSHSTVRCHLFAGICDTLTAGAVNGKDDENEDIKLHVMKFSEFKELINNGTILSSNAIIAMHRLDENVRFIV